MYFLRRLRPLEVAGERVRSLRVSLNAPVLSAPDLPAGPARALIVVHREPRGRMDITLGARAIASGEVAYWSFDGELVSDADLSVGADAALTFAESLGFLFDEAPLGGGAAADKTFRCWLAGEDAGAASQRQTHPPGRDDATDALFSNEPPELALEDLVIDEVIPLDGVPPRKAQQPASVAADPPRSPQRTLSKFRAREPASAAPGPKRKTALRQPLARVQLVKRRSPEDERKLVIRRLITSF